MIRAWIVFFCLIVTSCESQIVYLNKEKTVRDTIYRFFPFDSLGLERYQEVRVESAKSNGSGKIAEIHHQSQKSNTSYIVKTVHGDPGMLLYDIPDSMVLGKIYKIRIRVQKGTKQIDLSGTNKPITSSIRTSNKMDVKLIDPNPDRSFEISKTNSDQQLVEDDYYTEWKFDVKPIKPGNHELNLVISILSTDGGVKEIVYEDSVVVKNRIGVKIKSFWDENWKWIFSTLLIPIFVYFWNKRSKSKKD